MVFACGAVVMIYELIGSRIVAPFVGTSTYVWTSLIGVILAALSLGYWLGGRIADRRPEPNILAVIVFVAGGLVSITILLHELVLAFIASAETRLEIKAVLASLFLFAPASVALGMVTPYATRLRIASVDSSGRTVGRLYALSTIGSILGTFSAGFLLIPFVGSVRTLYLIAGVLIGSALLTAFLPASRVTIGVVVVFVLGIAVNELNTAYMRETHGLYDIDTQYNRIRVFDTTDPKSARPIRVMTTDPYSTQSAMFLDDDDLVFDYLKYYHLVRHYRPQFEHVLMIGGAGYAYPKDFLKTYRDARMDVVEIDPKMTELARQHFRLKDSERLQIFREDGRVFLNNAPSAKYDAVLMDAFTSLFSVPYQLTTVEAARQIERVLDDEGVVIFNLGASLRGRGSYFLQAELATYRSVFPQVAVFKVNPEYSDDRLQNVIIIARKVSGAAADTQDPQIKGFLRNEYRGEIPMLSILTDDLAPVEYYNSVARSVDR